MTVRLPGAIARGCDRFGGDRDDPAPRGSYRGRRGTTGSSSGRAAALTTCSSRSGRFSSRQARHIARAPASATPRRPEAMDD